MTIPLACIAVAWLLIYVPRFVVLHGQVRRPEGLDNVEPRLQQAKLEGRSARANGAHHNAFEGFAPFAAAVIVAHLCGADPVWSARLAVAYCALRLVYTVLYIQGLATARTISWFLLMGATAGLFVLAAVA